MKKLLLSTALLALTTGVALAADLPTSKEPLLPPPPPAPLWTGFYAGLNAGYSAGVQSQTFVSSVNPGSVLNYQQVDDPQDTLNGPIATMGMALGPALTGATSISQNGFLGGGQIGYNSQVSSEIVIGLEADFQGAAISGAAGVAGAGISPAPLYPFWQINDPSPGSLRGATNASGASNVTSHVDWIGTVRGRLGYLIEPNLLVYATGGLTYGGVRSGIHVYAASSEYFGRFEPDYTLALSGNQFGFGSNNASSQALVGWNAGAGLEWMFSEHWSLKGEAIYWDLGNQSLSVATVTNGTTLTNVVDDPGEVLPHNPSLTLSRTSVRYQGIVVRAGINYHFDFGGVLPVVAKY